MQFHAKLYLLCTLLVYSGACSASNVLGFAKFDFAQGSVTGYNSSGGKILLTRSSAAIGRHTVMFAELANHNVFGYLHAIRTGENPGYCKVSSITVTGGLQADVQCFESDGSFAASPHSFDLLYLANTDDPTKNGNPRLSYFLAKQSREDTYELDRYVGYNSDRGKISVRRNSVGNYSATVPRMEESGTGANVQITAYGYGNSICTIDDWIGSETQPGALDIDVRCFDPATEEPRDSSFQALVLHPDALPSDFAYTYSTHSGHSVTQDLVKYYTHTSVNDGDVLRGAQDHVVAVPMGRAFGSITLVTPKSHSSRICQILDTYSRAVSPRPELPPFNSLTVDPLCSTTASGRSATDAYSLLTIAPKEIFLPDNGFQLDNKYRVTLDIPRIREEVNSVTCDAPYYLNPLSAPGLREITGRIPLNYDTTGNIDVRPDWVFSFQTEKRNNRIDIHLEKFLVGLCIATHRLDITPALDQTHLTMNVDLNTNSVTTIDDDWLFTGFHFFGYVGETITVKGTEGFSQGEITFRITVERI